ncbi:MAG: threonine synthase [Bdellovibrionales bacterium]|nr:threonine synthase [Oligoflexia bacterium]
MNFVSTRNQETVVSLREALEAGLAPDGGLYVPKEYPFFSPADFDHCHTHAEVANLLLRPFFAGDEDLAPKLAAICENTFNFPIPLVPVAARPNDYLLELFHGPTSAFKDVGARFLAGCMEAIAESEFFHLKRTVIVATSGDTGGAVAAAFYNRRAIDVVILYPEGRISSRQEKQLCAWAGNVRAFAVKGSFDDCQRMVKEALLDVKVENRIWLSANSINLGRILPQMVYYAHASLTLWRRKQGSEKAKELPGFIIPSGNLGNSLACIWAKKLGLPIGPIHLAFNSNRGVVDFLDNGTLPAHPTVPTLANAMDVSKPSNLERMQHLFPLHSELQNQISASTINDDEIRAEIQTSEKEWGEALCPHSAVATVARKKLSRAEAFKAKEWVMVATAHPAKFEAIVEPLVGHVIQVPELLRQILLRPSSRRIIEADYAALKSVL